MRIVFILILFLSFKTFGQNSNGRPEVEKQVVESGVDIDQQDPNMDALYKRGPYLVYDCKRRHWVCTKELEYNRCKSQRREALLDYEDKLPCATFDIFQKRKDCWERQQELTNIAKYEQFCFHPSLIENKLTF